jgi:hypothetical protein
MARIHRSFYTSVPARALPLREKLALRRSLILELETWKKNISTLDLAGYQSSALSSFSFPKWYEALYYNSILLMFRPSNTFGPEEAQDLNSEEDALKVT